MPTRLRVAGGAALTYGLFADGSAELGDLTLTLGGRIDQWRLNDGVLHEKVIATGVPLTEARFAERRGTEWTGRAGAAWTPVSAVTLRAAGYRGWRLPTLNEPIRVGAEATAANAAPDPEGLVGVDGGGGFYRVRQNLDAIRSIGLEVDARWDRGPWSLRASWSHVDPRVEASGGAAALDGLRPAQTPRDLLSGSLAWRRGGAVR